MTPSFCTMEAMVTTWYGVSPSGAAPALRPSESASLSNRSIIDVSSWVSVSPGTIT